jgi:hypothetical protein
MPVALRRSVLTPISHRSKRRRAGSHNVLGTQNHSPPSLPSLSPVKRSGVGGIKVYLASPSRDDPALAEISEDVPKQLDIILDGLKNPRSAWSPTQQPSGVHGAHPAI